MKLISCANDNYKSFINKTVEYDLDTKMTVSNILLDIEQLGDKALSNYTKKFDNVLINNFKVKESEIISSYEKSDNKFIKILDRAIENIKFFHKKQTTNGFSYETNNKSLIGQKVTPIKRVAVYIPGGKAIYPSSVLMNVIPAQIAGVTEIVLVSPPNKNGEIDKNILLAANLLGIKEIYKIGGAQAIGALAYGTESIKKVDKIVGPGNKFVAEAKRQVFGLVSIDMIAGPSEILILADDTANAKYIARDLLSQAEHDENAIPYLVTTSKRVIKETKFYLNKFINNSKRKKILMSSIRNNLLVFKAKDLENMISISNEIAPEHLEILIKEPKSILNKITNAGSIFLGEYSPEPVGDYFAGPNHTLPTNQTAKFSSPLGVYDFIKRSSYIQYSKEDLIENSEYISYFAETEKLWEHSNSIKERILNEVDIS